MDKFKINNDFTEYIKLFLEENSKLNLISKNDEYFLFEKHIYDSLAIKLFFDKYNIKNIELLDIGCGGGFPSVPIAMEFSDVHVFGIDSVRKKISAINNIKDKLDIKNLTTICARVETLKDKKFHVVTSRAVAELSTILEYGLPLLKPNGYFIAYKSKKALNEIENAQKILKKYNAKVIDILEYSLPLKEVYERNLIVITF